MSKRPVLALTMGDPVGVGPEVIVKALNNPTIYEQSKPFVIGDTTVIQKALNITGLSPMLREIKDISEAKFNYGTIDILNLNKISRPLPWGKVSGIAGDAAFSYLKKAIELANSQQVDGIVTAPLNKESLHKGGHIYPGHTEILAQLTQTDDYAMMLTTPQLKVIHVTTHIGLIDAVETINPERVLKVIQLGHETMVNYGIEKPNIAICGINPHAGENGLFGQGEEDSKLMPSIVKARQEGITVSDPLPADTLFYRAVRGDFDIVVAMYHDQGHIPVKVLGLEDGVNITVGLPIIRTSVDHGTAFDIAGQNIAQPQSMENAIYEAIKLTN